MEECKNSYRCVLIPILAAFILGVMFVVGKYVEGKDLSPVLVSVQGESKVAATPDIARISFGVQTGRLKTAEEAMQVLSEKMGAVYEAVQAEGIEDRDITTESLYLNPAYDWDEGERIDQGFEASQSLIVKVRELGRISNVLGVATSAGANQVGGVSFTIDDPEALQAQAREEAIADAKEKAQVLANQLGKRLGKLKGFGEGGGSGIAYAESMSLGKGGGGDMAPPLPVGEQEIGVTVYLTYEIK